MRLHFGALGLAAAMLVGAGAGSMAIAHSGMERMLPDPIMRETRRPTRRRYRKTGWRYPSNGKRECERRKRQIARGSLTEANGLVRA